MVEKIKKEGINRNVDVQFFEKTARVYLGLEELARENKYDALAISCWPKFVDE